MGVGLSQAILHRTDILLLLAIVSLLHDAAVEALAALAEFQCLTALEAVLGCIGAKLMGFRSAETGTSGRSGFHNVALAGLTGVEGVAS